MSQAVGPLQSYGDLFVALDVVMDPVVLVLIFLMVVLGLMMGITPGLGGSITIALLIPLVYTMDANVAIMLMAAALGAVTFGGSISAILINTPGTAPNAATLLDGYPMARDGRAGEAITASAVSSALGAIIGLGLFALFVPFIRPISLSFGPPQLFWLGLIGIIVVAVAQRGDFVSDVIAGGFGLMIAFHGLNRITGSARFTWGTDYLLPGWPLIPIVIGMFAIAEMLSLYTKDETIAHTTLVKGGRMKGLKAVLSRPRLLLESSGLGWLIGLIPGVGGTLAMFVTYIRSRENSDDPEAFGSGRVEGVIAPEAANDASMGGALLPTLLLGIPGSVLMAVWLGAFISFGVTPGPVLLQDRPELLFMVIFAFFIANILTSVIGVVMVNPLSKITKLSTDIIVPVIISISLYGAFIIAGDFIDIWVTLLFGVIGYIMIEFEISRVTFIIAITLGPLIERTFHQTLQLSRGDYTYFVSDPLSIGLLLAAIVFVSIPFYRAYRSSGTDADAV